MTDSDLKKVAVSLGLGNAGLADALGIDVRRVRAYATGMRPIPQVVELACWTLTMRPRIGAIRKLLEM